MSAIKISAWIFLLIALLHLLRIILGWQAQIASWQVPTWASFVAVIIAGYLSYKLFRE
ncbi:MAG: hypothetical protein AABW87_03950 [Nanoarchaeota archaeon]